MAVSPEIQKQFVEYIKLQVFDDNYIDRKEEKKILETGIKNGIGVDEALSIIRQVASEKGIVVERDVEDKAKELLQRFAANDGRVDKKEFEDAVSLFKTSCKGRVTDIEIHKRLKQMMLDNGWKAKEGGLFGTKWFTAISV
ncbi:MAG: hypothetical protein BWK79_12285 [Beggiatoa sp. IS2]|nr:MAG: hypothetical protein BWK79_12285 [Beggiatoa sp. IS2]